MKARNTIIGSFAVAMTLGLVLLGTQPASAANEVAIEAPPPASTPADSTPTPPDMIAFLDPGTIALCNGGLGDVSVKSWDVSAGHIDMFCGDKNSDDVWVSGYNHIRERHQTDWQGVVDSVGGGGNWDDLMMFMTDQAMAEDDPEEEGDSKLCYTAPVEMHKADGTLVGVYNPTVIVSANNARVITSYPTVTPDCAGIRD